MNCEEFNQQLSNIIELQERSVNNTLRNHGSTCEHCQTRWNEFLLLDELMPEWNSNLPEVDLAASILSQLHENGTQTITAKVKQTGQRHQKASRISVLVLVTAVVLLVLAPFFLRNNSALLQQSLEQGIVQPDADISNSDIPNQADIPNQNSPNLPTLLSDAGHSYLELAHEFGNSFSDVAELVVIEEAGRSHPDEHQSVPSVPTATWVEDWGKNLKPIGSSVEKAFGFLFETILTDRQRREKTS